MNHKPVGSYVDEGTLYGTDKKALKMGIKEQRRREKLEAQKARKIEKDKKRKDKALKKAYWNRRKRELYNQAHSMNFYDQAEDNLANTRTHYDEKDIYKEQNKLRNREYRRLVRIEKKFWR